MRTLQHCQSGFNSLTLAKETVSSTKQDREDEVTVARGETATTIGVGKHWIDGQWIGSETVSESINPATGAVLGTWADGGEAEARAAIAAARRAFDSSVWSRDRALRNRVLSELAERFD